VHRARAGASANGQVRPASTPSHPRSSVPVTCLARNPLRDSQPSL
jgi:hypothetical protein